MTQNVTLKLEKGLLHKAKILATKKKTSLSRLMVLALKTFIGREEGYGAAKRKAAYYLEEGFALGGGSYYPSRENLHQRHA